MNEDKKNKNKHNLQIEYSQDEAADEDSVQSDPSQNSQSSEINYEDAFEEARREDILREINQENSQNEMDVFNEDVRQVLDKRTKREEKKQERTKLQEMKRLRQQNAILFFRKVKIEMLLNFSESLIKAKEVYNQYEQKIARLLSQCSLSTLEAYQLLKDSALSSRKRKDFINLILKVFDEDKIQLKGWMKYQVIWCLAVDLRFGFRKICFIDISHIDLESFYNLKYLAIKSKKKNLHKQIDILKNKLQRKVVQEELKDKNFVSIEQYAYNPKAHTQVSQIQSNSLDANSRSYSSKFEQIKEMKKTFLDSFCQIYCPIEGNWQLFNMEVLQTQQISQVKNTILEGKAVIGFYSVGIIQFRQEFKKLASLRMTNYFELRDQTIDFSDKYELVGKRRNRLGCKNLYKNLIKQSNIYKNLEIFDDFDAVRIQQETKNQLEWALNNFPKSLKEMKLSDYFVIPSLVEKYMMIKQGANPIHNLQFHEQKVYWKSDLERVSSRMGWIDCGRMVKDNQIPIKTTENKNKSTTKLYKFSQTEPFRLKFDEQHSLLLDQQFNSIYVPPHFEIPEGFCLVQENIQYLCKKSKLKCARIVQGFDVAGSHVVPNNIGYLVQQKYKDQIIKSYTERQEKLKLKRQQRKVEDSLSLWRKLFKSIIITQQVYSQ